MSEQPSVHRDGQRAISRVVMCAECRQPILAGVSRFRVGLTFVHVRCNEPGPSVEATQAGMTLARNVIHGCLGDRSEPICALCLSRLTKLPCARVADGWRDLVELSPDFEAESGHCADCGEMGAVLTRVKDEAR